MPLRCLRHRSWAASDAGSGGKPRWTRLFGCAL